MSRFVRSRLSRRTPSIITSPTIRECYLLVLPAHASTRLEPEASLEHGGRTYQVTRRESAGEVDYAFLRHGDD
jgi:hypothetical protein